MKKKKLTEIQKIIRDYYKQWNGQPGRNGQIPINVQPLKTESGGNKKYKQINYQ